MTPLTSYQPDSATYVKSDEVALIADKFGHAKVHSLIGHAYVSNVADRTLDKTFACFECGREVPESGFYHIGTPFRKTGSYQIFSSLHPHCRACRDESKAKWLAHPLYSFELVGYFRKYLTRLRAGADKRAIYFGIDEDDLLGKYLEQDGRCALSGLKLDPFGKGSNVKSGRNLAAPSTDRIDSRKHYTPDNIWIVLSAVNMMKGELPTDVFVELCSTIATKSLIG